MVFNVTLNVIFEFLFFSIIIKIFIYDKENVDIGFNVLITDAFEPYQTFIICIYF